MPPYVRGGVWTNVEDEILRAAVAKYGMQQWSRVASLLVRKTAKQCKARWAEWLSPAVRKSDWTATEDEKLLHLARIMPNMWRSIADMLGRTATQCLERYNALLIQSTETSEDIEDTAIESRPARPDFVDMDDDEQEMLMEARARLANTKGKKAKRKERERFLAQQQRLDTLEQRQTDKAAGKAPQKLTLKKSKYSVDYNAEIPFEHAAPQGAHDTTSEKHENALLRGEFVSKIDEGSAVQFGKAAKDEVRARKQQLPLPKIIPLQLPSPKPEPISHQKKRAPAMVGQFHLPAPKNDFEIAPPPQVAVPNTFTPSIRDMEAELKRKQLELEMRQASVVQRGLQLPVNVRGVGLLYKESRYVLEHAYEAVLLAEDDKRRLEALIDEEMSAATQLEVDTTFLRKAAPHFPDAQAAIAEEFARYGALTTRLARAYEAFEAESLRLTAFRTLAADEHAGISERIADLRQAVASAESFIY